MNVNGTAKLFQHMVLKSVIAVILTCCKFHNWLVALKIKK